MAEKTVRRAKVVLRKSKSYSLGGRKFIKDVPVIVKGGSTIDEFKQNGNFHVQEMEPKVVKKKKKKKSSEGGSKKKSTKKKKSSEGGSKKKSTKKKKSSKRKTK